MAAAAPEPRVSAARRARRPGPGAHDLPAFPEAWPASTSSCSASWSHRFRNDSTKTDPEADRLGPGVYQPQDDLTHAREPCFDFGGAPRLTAQPLSGEQNRSTRRAPGPDLEQADNHNFKRSPKHSFGTTPKFFKAPGLWHDLPGRGLKSPGPGEHCPKHKVLSNMPADGPSFSASTRHHPEGHDVNAPGPGSYSPQDGGCARATSSAPRCLFGASPRTARSTDRCSISSRIPAPKGSTGGGGKRSLPPGPGRYHTIGATRKGDRGFGGCGAGPKWSLGSRRDFDFRPPEARAPDAKLP